MQVPLANIELTFCPSANILLYSEHSNTSQTYCLFSKLLSNIKGQNGEEGHLGTTIVPLLLHLTKSIIALAVNATAGTNQFMSLCQFELNASTPKVPGFK